MHLKRKHHRFTFMKTLLLALVASVVLNPAAANAEAAEETAAASHGQRMGSNARRAGKRRHVRAGK